MTPPTPDDVEAIERLTVWRRDGGGNVDVRDVFALLDHVDALTTEARARAHAAEARAERYEHELLKLSDSIKAEHVSQVSARLRTHLVQAIRAALANDDGGDES